MFSIDFEILIKKLTPSALLYKVRFFCILKSFIAPIVLLYNDFIAYRNISLKRLQFTGQVIYLEKLLNDTYDSTAIYIEDIADINYLYIANKDEGYPLYLSNLSENNTAVYIANKSEYVTDYHFKVKIPLTLYNSLGATGLDKMKALINNYRIAGKKFIIESI